MRYTHKNKIFILYSTMIINSKASFMMKYDFIDCNRGWVYIASRSATAIVWTGKHNITDDEHCTRRTSEETSTPDAYCTSSIWRKNTNQNDLLVRIIDIIHQNQYLQCKLSTLTRIEQKLSVPLVLNSNREECAIISSFCTGTTIYESFCGVILLGSF